MKLAYLLMSCSDTPRVTDLTRDWVFRVATHAAGYFFDLSGERELMEFRVFDWVQLPLTSQQWNDLQFGVGPVVVPMVSAALQVDLSAYDHFVLVIDKDDAHSGVTTPARTFTHLGAQDLDPAILCHELGHQFTSNHAKLAVLGGNDEYGDSFCIMGAEGVKYSYPETSLDFSVTVGQDDWRYCSQCSELFYDGYPDKGICPGVPILGRIGGQRGHRGVGSDMYFMPHEPPEAGQDNWRYCGLCHAMFYDGYPTKGVCPANPAETGHVAAGYMFVLQHDVADIGQPHWRYCEACQALFYDGQSSAGACPARAGGHLAAGYDFSLLHDIGPHDLTGPGMVASNLQAVGWLDPTAPGVGVDLGAALRSRPAEKYLELAPLRGAPADGLVPRWPVVGWGDDLMPLRPGERLLLEYRTRDGRDRGIPTTASGAPGFLLVHALAGSGVDSSSVRLAALAVEQDASTYVDAGGLELHVVAIDLLQQTVTVRVTSDPWPPPPGQVNWRYCGKCQSMFYNGSGRQGVCPAGDVHLAVGLDFVLQHDDPGLPGQSGWRFCDKCYGLSYDGYPDTGSCPVEGHVFEGYDFALRHDGDFSGEAFWRYCSKCSAMFYDGDTPKGVCSAGGEHAAAGFDFHLPTVTANEEQRHPNEPVQNQWRPCSKCHSMFYDGYPTQGVCPAGGGHAPYREDYRLPHDVPFHAFASQQSDWRFCRNCFALFYNGFEPDGVCPASGHRPAGFDFSLPHDTPGGGQDQWRFCSRCYQLFYDGYPTKGSCARGGAHTAAGFDFRLDHR